MLTSFETHALFTENDAIKQICNPLKLMDIEDFIYIRRFPDGSFIDLATNLAWADYFLRHYFNGYYSAEYIAKHLFIPEGFKLWLADQDNLIWQEGNTYFNRGNGISFCSYKKEYSELFCFYTHSNKNFINNFYVNNIELLKKFCDFFLEKASHLIAMEEKNKFFTPEFYLPNIKSLTMPSSINSVALHEFLSTVDKKFLTKNQQVKNAYLTDRELECIQLSMNHRSAKEVANQLCISARTVETHLNNAKKKLGCSRISELIDIVVNYYEFK